MVVEPSEQRVTLWARHRWVGTNGGTGFVLSHPFEATRDGRSAIGAASADSTTRCDHYGECRGAPRTQSMTDLPLIGRGRAADVYDVGDGRVLRRYRSGRADSVAREVLAMRHLRAHGAPVPEVFSVEDADIVMERLDGS